MSLPYYKRYTRDLFDGTIGMGFENKLVYGWIIDLIMHHDGRLRDNPRYIAGQLECSVRKWNSIRKNLLEMDKIYIENGFISNLRADKEQISLSKFRDKQREKAKSPRKNNGVLQNPAKPKPSHTDTDTDILDDEDAGARDWKQIHKACLEAADPCLDQSAKMLMNFSKLRHWLEADPPCDLERDIIPTLKHVANRSKKQDVRSWNYFQRAVFDARDERLNTVHESSQKGNRNAGNYNGRSNGATSRDSRKAAAISWEDTFARVLLDRANKSR